MGETEGGVVAMAAIFPENRKGIQVDSAMRASGFPANTASGSSDWEASRCVSGWDQRVKIVERSE